MKFKYNIVKKSKIDSYEEFPKHFLGDTAEEAEALYKKYHGLLNLMAYNYSLASGVDKSDLFGEALLGLARAKKDYEEDRGAKFKTFALYNIKTALNEYVRKNSMVITVPAYIRHANRHLEALKSISDFCNIDREVLQESFERSKFEFFNDVKAAEKLVEKAENLFNNILKAATRAGISAEELIKRAEFVPTDIMYKEHLSTSDMLEAEENKLFTALLVDNIKKHMTPTQLAISEYIMDGRTYKEIGEKFERSDVWVKQELNKLRNVLEKRGVK